MEVEGWGTGMVLRWGEVLDVLEDRDVWLLRLEHPVIEHRAPPPGCHPAGRPLETSEGPPSLSP